MKPLLAVALILALAGCAGRVSAPETPTVAPSETPIAAESPAPTATAPTATPTAEPAVAYTGAATCLNLLEDSTVDAFVAQNASVTDYRYAEKIALEARNSAQTHVGLATFALTGGIVCGWGGGYEFDTMYAYGPLSNDLLNQVLPDLKEQGYQPVADAPYERLDIENGFGSFAFGNGVWAMSGVNGGPDLLDEVVANAPAWDEPEQLPPVSDEPLSTEAAEPADAPYLTTEGLGDLRLGQPVPAANEFVAWHPDTCFAQWLAKEPYGDYQLGTEALEVFVADHEKTGELQFIRLSDAMIPTRSGVRVGDSEATLLATYDDLEKVDEADATLYGVPGDAGRVVFEVAKRDSPIGAYRAGQITSIAAISFDISADLGSPWFWAPCTL